MIKRILIPLDGSELAEQVIPHLLRFVSPEQTELLLMSALSPIIPDFGELSQPSLEQVLALAGEEIRNRVHMVRQMLEQLGFRSSHRFLLGTPEECILRAAVEEHVDLIAMSTHGRTGIKRALLGSVADKVVRSSSSPVFLVPPDAIIKPEQQPQSLLIPLDGSQFAETVVPFAQGLAKQTGASIHLLRVIEPTNLHERELMFSNEESLSSIQKSLAQIGTNYLQQIQLRLQLAGVSASYQVTFGEPALAIVQVATTENSDLIFLSTHGRSGIERIVYGSVASQLIHEATCPLLLMHGQESVQVHEHSGAVIPVSSLVI